MAAPLEMESKQSLTGVYPPSFCNWQLLVAVVVITQIAVFLVGMGRAGTYGWQWIGMATLYAQWMALFCAAGLCVTRGWTQRLSPRGAWMNSWFITIVLAALFSYSAWLALGISGSTANRPPANVFVAKSVFSVALVTVVFFRYLMMRARWRFQLMAQAEARVQALQARIRPHFLFNSLNTIASLIPDDPAGAEAATEDLADIFRGSMRSADEPIPLADELQLGRQYLDMEKRRLGDRLNIDWRTDDLPPGASVMSLMLQPLLENAVAHGIQPRPDGGTIMVYGRSEGEKVVMTIGNPVAPEGTNTQGHGMAIKNIRERLLLAFGNRASLITNQDDTQFYAVMSFPHVEYSDR
jgi:two-component system sensor histidine kinase AlgZ